MPIERNIRSTTDRGYPVFGSTRRSWKYSDFASTFKSQKKRRLRTFSGASSSPEAVYMASVNQLKRFILNYRQNYRSSAYTILWHAALVYAANAALQNTEDKTWLFYFLLCLHEYEELRKSWRVAEVITKGLLSMALRNDSVSTETARRLLNYVQQNSLQDVPGELRATLMVDLDLSTSDPNSVKVERLAADFEDNVLLRVFTCEFDKEQAN